MPFLIVAVFIFIAFVAVVYVLPMYLAKKAIDFAGEQARLDRKDIFHVGLCFYISTGVIVWLILVKLNTGHIVERLLNNLGAIAVWPFGWSAAMIGMFEEDFGNPEDLFLFKIAPLLGFIIALAYAIYLMALRAKRMAEQDIESDD